MTASARFRQSASTGAGTKRAAKARAAGLCQTLRTVLEAGVPVRAVAEGLVLRGAAAAQRVVLAGRALARNGIHPDAPHHRIRAVLGDRDRRRPHLVAM